MEENKNTFDDLQDPSIEEDVAQNEYSENDRFNLLDILTEDEDEYDEESNEPVQPLRLVPRTRLTLYAILLILASVFLLCGVFLGKYYTDAQNTTDNYDQLASIYNDATQNTTPETSPSFDPTDPTETAPPEMLSNMKAIYELNNDLVGWIKIPNISVDYPVMQTPQFRDYYLYRDFFKNDNRTGCLYVRETCDVFKPSDNVVIYGHNMKTGDMFGRLSNYRNKSYWEKYPYFTFDTLYERHTYQIFTVFVTSGTQVSGDGTPFGYPYHRLNDFNDAASFNQFIADIKGAAFTDETTYVGRCFYETGITPVYGDKLICLSTCEYSITDGRLVIMAVRVS